MKQKAFYSLLLVAIFGGAQLSAAECPPDKVVMTNAGYYGAVNPDVYATLNTAVRKKLQGDIDLLVSKKTVVSIPDGKKACVLDVAPDSYRKRIDISGESFPYWVSDNAVTPVR